VTVKVSKKLFNSYGIHHKNQVDQQKLDGVNFWCFLDIGKLHLGDLIDLILRALALGNLNVLFLE
jgi:hypothetical protein